jgi:hypothetical protein
MVKKELITRSPLRILENSTQGGVGKGNIGVIAARKGVGKTACLVHIATDQLFQEKHVIHVSFANDTNHIVSWYEDIFQEIARRYKLDCTMDVHDDIIKRRVIMNFRQGGVQPEQVQKSIRSMVEQGNFSADLVVVDGFDFSSISAEEFSGFKKLAEEMGMEMWFSATLHRDSSFVNGIPSVLAPIMNQLAIIIMLEPREGLIHLKLLKDHESTPAEDLHLKLDPQILLIAEEA